MDTIRAALESGFEMVIYYLTQHTLTCLVPAFFIAGAIAAFIKKEAILRYFGPKVKRRISYPVASVSGAILAVCSCTILPLFAGLYKKGSGIGPATAFLYSGPAINVLAIVFTARVLGLRLGLARAVAAVIMALLIAFVMSKLFKPHDEEDDGGIIMSDPDGPDRGLWVKVAFFTTLLSILLVGASDISNTTKVVMLTMMVAALSMLLYYKYSKEDILEWGWETWDLTRKIFPILVAGTFLVGMIAYYVPPETFRPYLGGNGLGPSFLGSIIGAILYMPTLLEVPLIGDTFGYTAGVMGDGPALSLLLAGPSLSLPNMVVLFRIMGWKQTAAYLILVVILSTIMGFTYGLIVA